MSLTDALPVGLAPRALTLLLRGREAAWAHLDADNRVLGSGGALQRYGLEGLVEGADAVSTEPLLHGLLPLEAGALHLPRVQFPGGPGDLELLPDDGERVWLLVLDSRKVAERERALFQKGNELDLLRARWAGAAVPDGDTEVATVLGALDLVVFEHCADSRMRPLGPLPGWARPFTQEGEDGLELLQGDGLTFLDNFLVDAQRHWGSSGSGYLSSGMWSEPGPAGEERYLEAIAVSDERGRTGLVLQQLGSRYVERQRILQGAREARLDLEALRYEVQKKDVLLHCIVHDLRGPLSSLVGALSLLKRGPLPPEKVEALLDVSLGQARRQDEMIRLVLDVFSAELEELESFERDPALAPDLVTITMDAVRRMLPAFDAAGVQLRFEHTQETAPVVGRTDRLERILANLLDNALRYAPEGSAVELVLRKSAEGMQLDVNDRGPGVEPELQGKLFQRFSQGGEQRRGAAGLGLYFCHISLQAWGGAIQYLDRPGGGSTFRIQLDGA